jgi:hypothetical protein
VGESKQEPAKATLEQQCQVQVGECGRYAFLSEHLRPDGSVCVIEHNKYDTSEAGMARIQQFASRQFCINHRDRRNKPGSKIRYGFCSACKARLYAVLGEDISAT